MVRCATKNVAVYFASRSSSSPAVAAHAVAAPTAHAAFPIAAFSLSSAPAVISNAVEALAANAASLSLSSSTPAVVADAAAALAIPISFPSPDLSPSSFDPPVSPPTLEITPMTSFDFLESLGSLFAYRESRPVLEDDDEDDSRMDICLDSDVDVDVEDEAEYVFSLPPSDEGILVSLFNGLQIAVGSDITMADTLATSVSFDVSMDALVTPLRPTYNMGRSTLPFPLIAFTPQPIVPIGASIFSSVPQAAPAPALPRLIPASTLVSVPDFLPWSSQPVRALPFPLIAPAPALPFPLTVSAPTSSQSSTLLDEPTSPLISYLPLAPDNIPNAPLPPPAQPASEPLGWSASDTTLVEPEDIPRPSKAALSDATNTHRDTKRRAYRRTPGAFHPLDPELRKPATAAQKKQARLESLETQAEKIMQEEKWERRVKIGEMYMRRVSYGLKRRGDMPAVYERRVGEEEWERRKRAMVKRLMDVEEMEEEEARRMKKRKVEDEDEKREEDPGERGAEGRKSPVEVVITQPAAEVELTPFEPGVVALVPTVQTVETTTTISPVSIFHTQVLESTKRGTSKKRKREEYEDEEVEEEDGDARPTKWFKIEGGSCWFLRHDARRRVRRKR
ncbi:hypothetical protein LshimejAT787_1301050 [Lyophyllum shimeji]|uniref:Uncharacterized protein n=1 Tax=Lyophyllum shimeji TaxID=47721 RepID=A0A9P3PX49_LYOSH|nr:hypothetical protein LshimejAT787_1301050 [Lyophyllum shimeji]